MRSPILPLLLPLTLLQSSITNTVAEAHTHQDFGLVFHPHPHPHPHQHPTQPRPRQWRRRQSILEPNTHIAAFVPRGGDIATETTLVHSAGEEEPATTTPSLDDRVHAAMRRLGLGTDNDDDDDDDGDDATDPTTAASAADEAATNNGSDVNDGRNCDGGVCTIDDPVSSSTVDRDTVEASHENNNNEEEIETQSFHDENDETNPEESHDDRDIYAVAEQISKDMNVPPDIAMAAISASLVVGGEGQGQERRIDEAAARAIVKAEVDAMSNVSQECDEVKQLVSEGFDPFLSRRSLAFTEMNIDNARAILIADQQDEEAERLEMEQAAAAAKKKEEEDTAKLTHKSITVNSNFDPLASTAAAATPPKQQQQQQQKPEGMPPPAKKHEVIFEGTTQDLQKLVIESPVPVLLDVYADWCGPCKQLTPALEQICVNAGGMLRLVKINTDQQRQISSALEVKALPTVFGIRDGKILHMLQGMPRDEASLRNFLMGLMVPGQSFQPPVTKEEKEKYEEWSAKLLKLAAGASFSFSARERLQNKIAKDLDELVETIGGETGMAVADDTARVLRSLMSNVIKDPFEVKFRKINLGNKILASKVAQYPPCISVLKSIGFVQEGESTMVVAKGKKVVNIAPFVVGRDCIDKWIDKNRYQISAAARKRKDEIERARLAVEAEEAEKNGVHDEEEDEEEDDDVDPNLCTIKLRVEGKKKVHDIEMDASDTLNKLFEKLPFPVKEGEIVQFTCAAKRLIVKSSDEKSMSKTLSELKLMPAASVVVKIGERKAAEVVSGSLAERASSKKKKTGSHSMHSIGLYAKDDGNKGELIDGGGGTLWEHDVTDDEAEEVADSKDGSCSESAVIGGEKSDEIVVSDDEE